MNISGSHKIHAARQQVFLALLNPEVIKNSVPGCEVAEPIDLPTGRALKLVVSTSMPGFKGPYTIFLRTGEVIEPSRVTLITSPSNSMGSINATCVVDLADDPMGTNLSYNANAQLEGKFASVPEMFIKGGVKSALDHFFKNFEKQVNAISA